MKRVIIQAEIENEKLDEVVLKIRELLGAEVNIGVSDAPPKGAGATLQDVA